MEIIFENTYSNIIFTAEFGVISYPLHVQDEGVEIDDNVGLINFVGNGVHARTTEPHKIEVTISNPPDAVSSVFGRTGAIVAEFADYEANQIYKFDEKVENNVQVSQNTSLRHRAEHEWNGSDHLNMPTEFPPSAHTHEHSAITNQTADDHHSQSHTHDGIDGSGTVSHASLSNRDASNSHSIGAITDLQTELDSKALDSTVFKINEHIDESTGISDSGKPIVLNSQGVIDVSMIDASTFYYVGPHDPSDPANPTGEYPDTTGESHGAFWVAQDMITAPYTFTTGDLNGKDIDNGDFMVWGTGGWSIMRGEMNPLLYYKLDGSQALTDPFAGGSQQLKDIIDGTDDTDAATVAQVNERVLRTGDTMTGSLTVHGHFKVGNGVVYNSMSVQATDTENAPLFFLRQDGQNAGVIFYDSIYKVMRFIKYSEDDPTQIIGQAFLDEHGDLVTSNDLLSGDNITATSSINVGTNDNGNSAIRFHDNATGIPVIFWDNTDKEFKIDVNADEGFTIYHSGNANNNMLQSYWETGSNTVIALPDYDVATHAVYVDGLLLNPATGYTVVDTGTVVEIHLNNTPVTETCVMYYSTLVNNTRPAHSFSGATS
jgi:hypothetical protein